MNTPAEALFKSDLCHFPILPMSKLIRSIGVVLSLSFWNLGLANDLYRYQVSGVSSSKVWFTALQRAAGEEVAPSQTPDSLLTQRYRYALTLTQLREDLYEVHWGRWQVENEITPELKKLIEAIQRLSPVYSRRSPIGQLEFFALSTHEAWQRQAIASLLYPFQFVRPDTKLSEWRTEEAHPSGQLICRYRIVRREKDGSLIVNKVVAEVVLSPQERAMGKTHQILGHLRYHLNSRGVILSIKGTLRERVGLQGLPTSHVDLQLDIQLMHQGKLASKTALQKQERLAQLKGSWSSLYAPPTEAEQERARAESLLRDTTYEQLMQDLDAMLARFDRGESVPVQEQVSLRLKLEAAMVLYPQTLEALLQRLRVRPHADDGFWLIVSALSQSDTEKAQNGLVATLVQAHDSDLRRSLAQQLTFLRAPRPETVQALWELVQSSPSDEARPTLILSVANLARRIRAQSPALSDSIVEWCLKQIKAAAEPDDQRFWLQVLGALGDAKAMPVIEQHARRGEEMTRLSAIEALANQAPSDALRLIETLYPLEPSAAVREKMVSLITEEWWQLSQAREFVERAAFQDVSPRVRKACVQRLGLLAVRFANALNLLVKIAETNSSRDIRREAMLTLAALHASGVKVPEVKSAP